MFAPVPPAPAPPAVTIVAAPTGVNHGAGLLALDEARLLACWYSGRSEAGPDAVILCARSEDAGASWSPPAAVSTPGARDLGGARPAKSVGNVVLTRDRSGRLVMINGEVQSRRVAGLETCRSWRCGRIAFRVSRDEGRTWSAPTRLDDRPGALPRSGALPAPGLGDLLPVYREGRGASVLRLDLTALEPGRRPAPAAMIIPGSAFLLQPSLVAAAPPAGIAAYLRDRRRGFVYLSRLDAARMSWSAPVATDLPNPNSAVAAFTYAGQTGVVYNPSRSDRATLAMAFSLDGQRFPRGCVIAPQSSLGDVAYPSLAPLGDGFGLAVSVHGKRAIAFLRLNRAFLDACAAASGPRGRTAETTS